VSIDKSALLAAYKGRHPGLEVLIETGLWQGRGSGMAVAHLFTRYYAIDIDRRNVELAREAGFVGIHCGNSADRMPLLLGSLGCPALFWLDAHYVESIDGDLALERRCPLLAELRAIREWEHGPASVVLIDDVRLLGTPGWPTLAELGETAGALHPWRRETRDDVLRLEPV
jgi:hypothetical protein